MSQENIYKITAIVSVYNAEEFLRGCLEDLIQQTIFAQTEVIVIDACSPQNERAIAQEFMEKYSNILYVRTPQRETLYASWNRGIGMARGEYITNANADDRHAPHAFERLAAELDAHPEVALVYAKYRITAQKNAFFATAPIKRQLEWIAHDHINLLRRTEVGPQPLWRKSVHAQLGLFDARFTVGGDYDMWLRISEQHALRYIPEELGLCLEYDNNLEASNPQRSYDECYQVKFAALRRFMQPEYTAPASFAVQLRRVSSRLSRFLERVKQGHEVKELSALELQFFAYALLMSRAGNIQNALEILNLFYSLITDSKNIAYVYRFLLLTSVGELPGHLRQELALANQEPKVAVILYVYDNAQYLEEALLSVLAQKETRWELCLAYDSKDATVLAMVQELYKKYDDSRIQWRSVACGATNAKESIFGNTKNLADEEFFKTEKRLADKKPLGDRGALRNIGVQVTRAPFICIVEAKDLLAPSYFQEALQLLENAESPLGWVCPKTLVFGQRNRLLWQESPDFFQSLLHCPCPPSAVYRRELWEDVQGYAERATFCAETFDLSASEAEALGSFVDWDFWVRAGEQGWTGCSTAQVSFMQREFFQKEDDAVRNGIYCQQQFLKCHAWWFKLWTMQDLLSAWNSSPMRCLPVNILHTERVAQARAVYADKEAFTTLVAGWKG